MSEKFGEHFEKIDNEKINSDLNKLEDFINERIENKIVLNVLNRIDNIDKDSDIDLSYNPLDKKYYIIKDGEINTEGLTANEFIGEFGGIGEKIEAIEIQEDTESYTLQVLMEQIGDLYKLLKKDPNNQEAEKKVKELEEKYYEKTGFPVPFNKNNEMITDGE